MRRGNPHKCELDISGLSAASRDSAGKSIGALLQFLTAMTNGGNDATFMLRVEGGAIESARAYFDQRAHLGWVDLTTFGETT